MILSLFLGLCKVSVNALAAILQTDKKTREDCLSRHVARRSVSSLVFAAAMGTVVS